MHSFFERTTCFIKKNFYVKNGFIQKKKQWTNDIGSFTDMKKLAVF